MQAWQARGARAAASSWRSLGARGVPRGSRTVGGIVPDSTARGKNEVDLLVYIDYNSDMPMVRIDRRTWEALKALQRKLVLASGGESVSLGQAVAWLFIKADEAEQAQAAERARADGV